MVPRVSKDNNRLTDVMVDCRKDDYAFFLRPVKSENVPGYADVVKRPMDLGTMSHKVSKGKYRSLEDFAVRPHLFVAFCVPHLYTITTN